MQKELTEICKFFMYRALTTAGVLQLPWFMQRGGMTYDGQSYTTHRHAVGPQRPPRKGAVTYGDLSPGKIVLLRLCPQRATLLWLYRPGVTDSGEGRRTPEEDGGHRVPLEPGQGTQEPAV